MKLQYNATLIDPARDNHVIIILESVLFEEGQALMEEAIIADAHNV